MRGAQAAEPGTDHDHPQTHGPRTYRQYADLCHGPLLRLAGYGPGAADVVGLADNTDLYFTIRNALGLVDDAAHGSDHGAVRATPSSVKQGRPVTIRVSRFEGDRQVSVKLSGPQGDTVTRDLSGGATTLTVSPRKKGTSTVTVKGLQSGRTAKDSFRVT